MDPPDDWFWLYRPSAPSTRAQAIQVLNAAHATASTGRRVTVAVDPLERGLTPEGVLAPLGLAPVPTLTVHVLPRWSAAASVAYRGLFSAWVRRTGGRGVVVARSKRYAAEALRRIGKRFLLVVEAHEVDSLQAAERGEDPGPHHALEARVLGAADGVIANAPGTLRWLRTVHPDLPPAVVLHNGTRAVARTDGSSGEGVGYIGSVRSYKDVVTLAAAADRLDVPVTVVGGARPEGLPPGRLRFEPPVPHREVPSELARFAALVLPLSPGLYGEALASPLKLWDYLASGVPFVGADLPSLHLAAPGAFLPYTAGDPASLATALRRLLDEAPLRASLRARAFVRTWNDRARELHAFVGSLR